MYHDVDKQAFTGTGEFVYVICDPHDSPVQPPAKIILNLAERKINTGKSAINRK
ncbi:MAG TPA: hypothetical protein VKB81_17125 [Nitrospira sp.]|nr:hypothetical protein [Nitrospira sp.]